MEISPRDAWVKIKRGKGIKEVLNKIQPSKVERLIGSR